MSFQGYLNTIRDKTGMGPAEIERAAADKGYLTDGRLRADIKASEIIVWLEQDYDLGRGHAMAIVALLNGTKNVGDA